jgi:hypothetical protein
VPRTRVRHHRRPDRPRDGPRAQARRAPPLAGLNFVVLHTKGGAVRWFKVSPVDRDDPRLSPRPRAFAVPAAAAAAWPAAAGRCRSPGPWQRPAAVVAATCCRWPCWPACCSGATPGAAPWLGWVFATAWLTGTFWWLFISMHVYGGLPAPLAVLAVLLLAAFLALYYALVAAFRGWRRTGGAARRRPVRRALARRGTAARHLVHRLSLGRGRLCARRRAAGARWRPGSACTASPGAAVRWLAWLLSLLVRRGARLVALLAGDRRRAAC